MNMYLGGTAMRQTRTQVSGGVGMSIRKPGTGNHCRETHDSRRFKEGVSESAFLEALKQVSYKYTKNGSFALL